MTLVNEYDPNDTKTIPLHGYEVYTIGDRLHFATGDFGREWFLLIEATGWVSGYGITVNTTGNGTVNVMETALSGSTVSVDIQAGDGSVISTLGIIGPDGQIIGKAYGNTGTTQDTVTFTMPAGAVTVNALFESHTHTLEGTEAKAATCTEEGNEAYWTCTGCGKLFADAEATTETTQAAVTIAALGHDWGEWTVVKEATNEEDGLKERTCKRDATHVETQVIPKTEPAPTPEKTTDQPKAKASSMPATGDQMPLAIFATGAVIGAIALVVSRRKSHSAHGGHMKR